MVQGPVGRVSACNTYSPQNGERAGVCSQGRIGARHMNRPCVQEPDHVGCGKREGPLPCFASARMSFQRVIGCEERAVGPTSESRYGPQYSSPDPSFPIMPSQ